MINVMHLNHKQGTQVHVNRELDTLSCRSTLMSFTYSSAPTRIVRIGPPHPAKESATTHVNQGVAATVGAPLRSKGYPQRCCYSRALFARPRAGSVVWGCGDVPPSGGALPQ